MSGDVRRERSAPQQAAAWDRVQRARPEMIEAARAVDLGTVRLGPHGSRGTPQMAGSGGSTGNVSAAGGAEGAKTTAANVAPVSDRANSFAALQDGQAGGEAERHSPDNDTREPVENGDGRVASPAVDEEEEETSASTAWSADAVERRAKSVVDEWLRLRDLAEAKWALAEVPLPNR
eukprot:ctg_6160.g522